MKARYALLCALTVLGICAVVDSAPAQGTAFTYQGCLYDSGGPANGNYDLQFTLYNDGTHGGSLGIPVTLPATPVTNGLFTVTLDFGAGIFAGQPLWLEICVGTNGGQSSFFTLSPRQPFTSSPYAVTAANLSGTLPASQLTGLLPVSQLSGTIPFASVAGAQPANLNLATNLIYTNYYDAGLALLPVCIGHTYVYYPTEVNGIYVGSYVLQIIGTNFDDTNAYFVDPGAGGYFGAFQTNQVFVATQSTVTFVNGTAFTGGPVTDTLFDLANLTINGTVNGTGQFIGLLNGTGQFTGTVNGTGQFNGNLLGVFSGTITNSAITNSTFSGTITNSVFSGAVTNSTLAGDAQGGAVTNLDSSVANVSDYGGSLTFTVNNAVAAGAGTIYVPRIISVPSPLTLYPLVVPSSENQPILIRGNLPNQNEILFTGSKTNLFDQYGAGFGAAGLDLRNLWLHDAILSGGAGSSGYIAGPGASGGGFWSDDVIDFWQVGALFTQSGMQFQNITLNYNGIGLIAAPYSDSSFLTIPRAVGQTNAGVELDSRGNIVNISAARNNIDVLVGGGGDDMINISSETSTNCSVAVGYPPNWIYPTTNGDPYDTEYFGTQMGNDVAINPIRAGFGYGLASSVNWTDQFACNNSAFMKVWNNGFFGGAELECETLFGEAGVISYTQVGDIAPYSFDFFTTGGTNLFVFSDGTTIPCEDGYKVGVNLPELQFTRNVLKYSRDTNGNLFAAGNITAVAGHFGSLTVTGVATSINTYTTDHVATAQDNTILVNGQGLTITLPDAAALGAGRSFTIKLIAGSTATVASTGAQTIDGSASYTLSGKNKYVMVQSDGAQWWVLANN